MALKLSHVTDNTVHSSVLQADESIFLFLNFRSLVSFFSSVLFISVSLFLIQSIFTLAVERADRAQIVERTTISLNVNSHALEHFKGDTVMVDFENFSLVLLEEAGHGELEGRAIRSTQFLLLVSLVEQA